MRTRRRLVAVLSVALLLGVLVMPLAASATKTSRAMGFMMVPARATQDYTLTVGDVSVTIPPGALPKGGPVMIHLTADRNGGFCVDFLPDRKFTRPVLIKFGSAEVVYYHYRNMLVPIRTSDIDGDGELGEVWMEHFSRYSGWF